MSPSDVWEEFLLEGCARDSECPISFSWRRRAGAALDTVRALHTLRTEGWPAASSYLQQISLDASNLDHLTSYEVLRLARRELVLARIISRFAHPGGLCLGRAVGLCAYARALGLPVQVVLGRARALMNPSFTFHAWIELDGVVLYEEPSVQRNYKVLIRVPAEPVLTFTQISHSERGGTNMVSHR